MVEKQQIIIGYFRQGKSKRKLAKELQVSRNTVKKYIAEFEANLPPTERTNNKPSPLKKGILKPTTYDSSKRSRIKLTDEVCGKIKYYLDENDRKKSQGKAKQQMRATDIHAALLEKGYQIGYTTVCRYVREIRQRSLEVYIRQHHLPGQAIEFDWGEVKLGIDQRTKNLMLAVFTCAYSNHRWARLFYRQDMSSFLHAHTCYFSHIRATPCQMVYDNMRVAVRRFTIRNVDKLPTEDLLKLSMYYQFDYRFCNIGKGNEKGHVERSVEYIRRKAFCREDNFESLEQANQHLLRTCEKLNKLPAAGQTESIDQRFTEELSYMKAVPSPYDASELRSLRVDKYSCIKVDTNYYSVKEGYVGCFVEAKIYPDSLEVYDTKSQCIGQHQRHHTRYQYFINLDHYLKTLCTKPGALSGSLGLSQADQRLRELFENHFKHHPKSFIELLSYISVKQYSIDQLQHAVQKCIQQCPHHSVNLDKLKILLVPQSSADNFLASPSKGITNDITQHCNAQLKDIQKLISSNKNNYYEK